MRERGRHQQAVPTRRGGRRSPATRSMAEWRRRAATTGRSARTAGRSAGGPDSAWRGPCSARCRWLGDADSSPATTAVTSSRMQRDADDHDAPPRRGPDGRRRSPPDRLRRRGRTAASSRRGSAPTTGLPACAPRMTTRSRWSRRSSAPSRRGMSPDPIVAWREQRDAHERRERRPDDVGLDDARRRVAQSTRHHRQQPGAGRPRPRCARPAPPAQPAERVGERDRTPTTTTIGGHGLDRAESAGHDDARRSPRAIGLIAVAVVVADAAPWIEQVPHADRGRRP